MKTNIKSKILLLIIALTVTLPLSSCSNQEATEYINQNGHTYTVSFVTTPKDNTVTTRKYSPLTAQEIKDANNYVSSEASKKGWNITKLREPTLSYNCHSYAWYNTSTSNVHWINDPSKYWTDGSYSLITSISGTGIPSSAANGSKVTYVNSGAVDHSAIKITNTKFRSKWGFCGLYEHAPGDSPYGTETLKYYKYFK